MDKLTIVFIHPNRTRVQGGIANAGISYVRGLLACGHAVKVWTASPFVATEMAKLGIEVTLDSAFKSWFDILRAGHLRRRLVQGRHSVDAYVHNTGHLWPLVRLIGPRRHFVVFHNEKLGGRIFFSHWLAISSAQRARLEDACRRLPWVRSVGQIRNGLAVADAAAATPDGRDPIVFGALAEFRTEKRMDLLVEAAAILRRQGHAFRFRMGGDGPCLEDVKRFADRSGVADAFDWVGWVDDIDGFYAAIDVLCLPSRLEPFGLVLLEAMARGKPVVATRTDGPVDILDADPPVGWLVDPDDAAKFADALAALILTPGLRAAAGAAAPLHVRHHYGDAAVGQSLERALRTGLLSAAGRQTASRRA